MSDQTRMNRTIGGDEVGKKESRRSSRSFAAHIFAVVSRQSQVLSIVAISEEADAMNERRRLAHVVRACLKTWGVDQQDHSSL